MNVARVHPDPVTFVIFTAEGELAINYSDCKAKGVCPKRRLSVQPLLCVNSSPSFHNGDGEKIFHLNSANI